jgi:hypothetical protein
MLSAAGREGLRTQPGRSLSFSQEGLNPPDPAVLFETANLCMSSDMFGPMSNKPEDPLNMPR